MMLSIPVDECHAVTASQMVSARGCGWEKRWREGGEREREVESER